MDFDRGGWFSDWNTYVKGSTAKSSDYVERASDQIGYKKPQATSKKTKMPRKTGYAKKRSRDKAMMPRTRRRPAKKKRTTLGKTFRKATKTRKTASKYAKRHYDDFARVARTGCNYLGFQTHGSHDRVYDILGEAVTKALLAKLKIYPRVYEEAIFDANVTYDVLRLTFKRVTVPGGELQLAAETDVFITSATTFESLSRDVGNKMQDNANGPAGTFGAYLNEAQFLRQGQPATFKVEVKDIGDSVIDLYVNQSITIRNMTDSVAGSAYLDRTDVNPIHGRKYVFRNQKTHVIDTISEKYPTTSTALQTIGSRGIISPNIVQGDEDHPFNHPPAARQVFSNCAKDTYVSLQPGKQKIEKTTFHLKMKLRSLIEKVYYNSYDKGNFGGLVLFGFELQHRGMTDNVDPQVEIAFDRALHMSAHCQFVKQKTLLKHYENEIWVP